MTALPLQPVYGHPGEYSGQSNEYAFLDLPGSAPGSGATSAHVSPTPAMAHHQQHSSRVSPTPIHPPNGYSGSPNDDGPWWNPSNDSTPPSANGAHTTPPNMPNGQHAHPQYSLPPSGDMYTPMYPGSQLVTPSTQPYHAGPMGSSVSYTRPPMTTSLSYPGPMFAGGSHLPATNGDKGPNAGPGFHHTPGPSQGYHFGMPPPPVPHVFPSATPQHQMAFRPGPNGLMTNEEWVGEWEDDEHPGEWYNGTMEIKHRRRTSPEQLKVLEHWFDINSKPDNALREWLAGELGMTKRNVQVWFQNRRAKIKGQMIRDRAAQEKAAKEAEGQKTPEGQIMSARPTPVPAPLPHPFPRELRERAEQQFYGDNPPGQGMPAPPAPDRGLSLAIPALPNGGRRVSLASGEADRIQVWAAKRNGAAPTNGPGFAGRSPVIGQASAARRGSIPYPAPLSISTDLSGRPGSGSSSPKFSPLVRPAPSTLHLTAIRNNTRRASMPGPPQLLSSGPFTPPRVVSYPISAPGNSSQPSQLMSIKDSEGDLPSADPSFIFSESDFSTTFLTPPSSTYDPSGTYPTSMSTSISSAPGQGGFEDFAKLGDAQNTSGPFPNPGFSFGKNAMFSAMPEGQQSDEDKRAQAIYQSIQQRGRLGSLASIGTCDSDGTGGTGATSTTGGVGEDLDFGDFDPNRRASAPSGLLDLGLLGLSSYNGFSGSSHRPSPLGANFTSSEPTLQPPYLQTQYGQNQLGIPPSSEHSPSDGSLHASPVEMVMSASMSAPTSLRSQSPHTPQGTSPTHPPNFSQVQNQYRSLSVSSKDPHASGDGEDFWNFPAEAGDGGFSLMVPTMTVSAPASAYPGSMGESQQQGLMAPADIPGKDSGAGSRRGSIGVGGGSS